MPSGESDAEHDALVETWVEGWTVARGTSRPVPVLGGFRVDVGWPQQASRYVFPRLSAAVEQRAAEINDPWVFLKVCAPPDRVRTVLPERWIIQSSSYFMTCVAPMSGATQAPDGYKLEVVEGPALISVKILTRAGDLAANGHAALVNGHAIYDRIETNEAHRRRGLGRVVMKALESLASARGVHKGVLVATEDGRALYEQLGWRLNSPYTSAVIPGAEPPGES